MCLDKVMEIKLALAEKMIGGFKKGSIYAIATRPGVGKTHFCMSVANLFASRNQKVLYISNSISEEEFFARQQAFSSECGDNISFEEVYKLTLEGFDMFASEDDYSLIVLDPFDIYSLDLDIGDLKEFAKKKNIAILLTTNLARPPIDEDRTHPVLSDMKFIDEKAYKKLIAFSELILFLTQEPNTNEFGIYVAKNPHGDIGFL